MTAPLRFENSLAFYGTLRPGEHNHWVVKNIVGSWTEGVVRGYVFEVTWGQYEGYPGLVLDPKGHRVPVSVLTANDLPAHFDRIDDFEGPGYDRRPTTVYHPDGLTTLGQAGIYETLTNHD